MLFGIVLIAAEIFQNKFVVHGQYIRFASPLLIPI